MEVLEMERLWGLERTHVFIVLELNMEQRASAQAAPDVVEDPAIFYVPSWPGERH